MFFFFFFLQVLRVRVYLKGSSWFGLFVCFGVFVASWGIAVLVVVGFRCWGCCVIVIASMLVR